MKNPVACAAVVLFLCNFILVYPVEANSKRISESEAIRVAEQFIADNGYTQAAAKKTKLAPESFNRTRSREEMLSLRHNSLEPKAYGVFEGGQFDGWGVVFKHSKHVIETTKNPKYIDGKTGKEIAPSTERETGRVLMMDESGHKCMIMHKDFFLDNQFKHLQDSSPIKPDSK